jgi:hypothetical protein
MLLILFAPFLIFLAVALIGAKLVSVLWPFILIALAIGVVARLLK